MRTTVVALCDDARSCRAGGCGPKSQIDPHASVTVNGTIQTESGRPSPATPVKLIRHPDALQAIGEVFVAVGSVGLACIAGPPRHLQLVRGFDHRRRMAATRSRCAAPIRRARSARR